MNKNPSNYGQSLYIVFTAVCKKVVRKTKVHGTTPKSTVGSFQVLFPCMTSGFWENLRKHHHKEEAWTQQF